jgi:hypothetical protein
MVSGVIRPAPHKYPGLPCWYLQQRCLFVYMVAFLRSGLRASAAHLLLETLPELPVACDAQVLLVAPVPSDDSQSRVLIVANAHLRSCPNNKKDLLP